MPTPTVPSSLMKSSMNKSLTRSPLDSPSTTSSMSTDVPQIELKPNTSRTTTHIKSPVKQRDFLVERRTPTNENLKSEEQHLTPTTPSKNVRLQPPSEINNHLLNKINTSPRLFLALFDYDPHAMSPNQDSEEELPFKQGQIIKV
jgi:hypothetical protein